MMKSRILKAVKYLLITFVAALLIMVVINFNDEEYRPIPESADAQKQIEKSTNAYFAIVGFNAAASEDMHQMGYKVLEEFETYVVDKDDFEFNVDQVLRANDLKIKGDANILYRPNRDEKSFIDLLEHKQEILDFRQKNHQLYKRYRELIAYKQFRENSHYIPSWSGILSLHDLHLNLIGLEWLEGDKNKAATMLSDVMSFNRMLFEDSDLLINRMIATALLSISHSYYSEISSRCKTCTDLDRIIKPMPSLSLKEICLEKSFHAELKYLKNIFIKTELYNLEYDEDKNLLYRFANNYFSKPAATFNEISDVYNTLLQTCELETYEITPFLEKNKKGLEFNFPWYSYIYNPVGKYPLENEFIIGLSDYIDLMLNIETQLRLLKLQRLIYANKIKSDGVTAYLNQQDSSLRNPFTNKPFNFDKKDNVLYFGDDKSKSIIVPLRRI